MNVSRPLCSTCFRQPREPASARCHDCGPGRVITVPKPRTPTDPDPDYGSAAEQHTAAGNHIK